MNNNRNVSTFSPFITFCQYVIPLAYDESMSYYETLCALRDYLVNTVIPAVNNNADAVTELQDKYTEFTNNINNTVQELENYIDNYFNNLDVQTEINNKLDQMAEDGQLQDIIAQYLELASILAFNTRNDLKSANNLNDGSFTYCFGKTTYNDGYGAFYKIRQSINTDVADDDNIIALTNYPNLVAEKMPNNNFNEQFNNINSQITGINNNIDEINTKLTENEHQKITIIIGDSWTSTDEASVSTRDGADTWVTEFENNSPNQIYNMSYGGAGFSKQGTNGVNFNGQLQNAITQIGSDNLKYVNQIIIYGGINDINGGVNNTQIVSAFNTLYNTINQNFPNSQNYLCFFNLVDQNFSDSNIDLIHQMQNSCQNKNWHFNCSIAWIFGNNFECFATDHYHPNTAGAHRIYQNMMAFINGNTGVNVKVNATNLTFDNGAANGAVDSSLTSNSLYLDTLNAILYGQVQWSINSGIYSNVGINIQPKYYCTLDWGFKPAKSVPCACDWAGGNTTSSGLAMNSFVANNGSLWWNGFNGGANVCQLIAVNSYLNYQLW